MAVDGVKGRYNSDGKRTNNLIDIPYRKTPNNFPHRSKLWEFQPMGSFQGNIGPADIIRFNISSDDFWDPYSAFIDIIIDVSTNTGLADDGTFTNKLLSLDASAQSFFNRSPITSFK